MVQAPPPSWTRLALRRGVPWLGALFIAAVLALVVFDLVHGYRATVAQTGRELDAQARIIAEQTARSLQAVDVVLRHFAQQFRQGAFEGWDDQRLHVHLREQAVGLVQVEGLSVVGADGRARVSSVRFPLPQPALDLSGFMLFRTARADPQSALVIDDAMQSPVDRRWVFPMGRRLEDADGGFAGVIAGRGRIEYYEAFYRDIALGPGSRITLLHREGALLARYPPEPASLGRRFAPLADLLASYEGGKRGPVRAASPIDGVDRFVAVRPVPDYPLVVAVTRDSALALAPWRAQALGTVARTLALAALAGLLLALAMRQFRRLQAAQRSLEAAQERYQLAVAGSNEGLWDWDLRRDTLFVSARAQSLFGREPGEASRPRRVWMGPDDCHPEDLARVRTAWSAHLRGRTPHFACEYRMRHASGEWRWYRQRGIAVRDAAGRPYRVAGSLEDVTDRRNAEAERERLEGQLRQAQKLEAIGTLAGGIAHDFNNILAAILGYGELAQKQAASGSAQRRHLDAVLGAAMRARSLVERILAFSRSGVGRRVPVHVQSIVNEALDMTAASLPAGVRLAREIALGDAALLGDPTQIHQVALNLCANAVQAVRGAGEVRVAAHTLSLDAPRPVSTTTLPAGRYMRLQVQDSGIGMAPEVVERIFDPFFTTKAVGVGTGLGLSLVHGIVTDLGGGIDVQSRPGEGSVFTVYLPWQCELPAPTQAAQPMPMGHGETVLLVDDEEALVRLGEEMLAELGYEPVGFVSSLEALASLRATPQRYELVLSDELMPEMTGCELVRELRRVRPDMPVLLMSGHVTPALAQRASEAGVTALLAKPLAQRELARSLAEALHPIATEIRPAPA